MLSLISAKRIPPPMALQRSWRNFCVEIWPAGALAAVMLLMPAAAAATVSALEAKAQAIRVLPPHTGQLVERSFAAAAPTWRLHGARISASRVEASVCRAESCWSLVLTDPALGCNGRVVGQWCAEWEGDAPDRAEPLFAALANERAEAVWFGPAAHSEPSATTPTASGAPQGPAAAADPHSPTEASPTAASAQTDGAAAGGYSHHVSDLPNAATLGSNVARGLLALVLGAGMTVAAVALRARRAALRGSSALRRGNPGWLAVLWLGPNIVLGFWLTLVPDSLAFVANQLVLLLHVVFGLLSLPPLFWLTWRHIIDNIAHFSGPGWMASLGKLGSTAAVLGALLSGLLVLDAGQGMPESSLHLLFSCLTPALLIVHLRTLALRRLLRPVLWATSACGTVLCSGWLLGSLTESPPTVPLFAFQSRPISLYDEAAWCGSCHEAMYSEWKNSVHGGTFRGAEVVHEQRPLQEKGFFRFQITDAGGVLDGSYRESRDGPAEYATCSHCHAPVQYYSDSTAPGPFGAAAPVGDGITCSFCHTLRGVRDLDRSITEAMRPGATEHDGKVDLEKAFAIAPFYVSAPETVRRYLGQNARDPLARWIGDRLINWWPEVHRRDYHSEFLDTAAACQGCHGFGLDGHVHGTFVDWEKSDFAKGGPSQQVSCQDCHMVREMTGKKVSEPGKHVAWGPERPRRTLHLFAGGNANWSGKYALPQTASFQREWNKRSAEVEVTRTERRADELAVTVQVRTPLIGHSFPSMETVLRYAWIEVQVADGAGKVVAQTRPVGHGPLDPKKFAPAASGQAPPSILLYRTEGYPHDGTADTLIPANGRRDFTVFLPLTTHDPAAVVHAQLYHSWDDRPLAHTTVEVR